MLPVLLCFFVNFSSGQDTLNIRDDLGRKQGMWKIINIDNEPNYIAEIVYYKDDLRDGLCTLFYPNGNIRSESYYLRDTLNGPSKEYYEYGYLYRTQNFTMGKVNGIVRYFDYGGNLKEEMEYKDGLADGVYKRYYRSGRLMSESIFLGEIENGIRKIYSDTPSNELIREFEYVNGTKISAKYYENGELFREESF